MPLGLLAIAGGIAFLFSPSGRALTGRVSQTASTLGRLARVGLEANGPGISRLRELGCLQAGLLDTRALADMSRLLGSENSALRHSLPADARIVFCKLRRDADALDCEVAARAYAHAAQYSREFWIEVFGAGAKRSCSGRFDPQRSEFSPEEPPIEKDTP
ncbi:MAG TPA: hypothetical protein VII78_13285 [Myxococcota bacterium]